MDQERKKRPRIKKQIKPLATSKESKYKNKINPYKLNNQNPTENEHKENSKEGQQ